MKNKAGISYYSTLTEVQQKTRRYFCALVDYGFKEKELIDLGGYVTYENVRNRIKRCKSLSTKD